MATAIKLLATQMEAMEASFLSIFFGATAKIADLTESKLFCLMETSSGTWKIAGHPDLKSAFKSGNLLPRNNEVELDNEIRRSDSGNPFQDICVPAGEEERVFITSAKGRNGPGRPPSVPADPVHFGSRETSSLANWKNERPKERKRKKTKPVQGGDPCVKKEACSVKKTRFNDNDNNNVNIFNISTFNEVDGFDDGSQAPPKEDLSTECCLVDDDETIDDTENTETKMAGGKFDIIIDESHADLDGQAAETEADCAENWDDSPSLVEPSDGAEIWGNQPKWELDVPPTSQPPKRRKKAQTSVNGDETAFPCPGCNVPLPAKICGVKEKGPVRVLTPQGWVVISVSGDIRIPCLMCIASEKGLTEIEWRKATFTSDQLKTHLIPRMRQHLYRRHHLLGRHPEAVAMRWLSKRLLCQQLHESTKTFGGTLK